jgi:hypothetical protein
MAPMLAPLAAAEDLDVACQQNGPDKKRLECDVRFHTPREADSVTATIVGSGQSLPVISRDRYPNGINGGQPNTSAFLFLFDLSDPARTSTVSANISNAQRILRTATWYDRFGIATFPGSGRGATPSLDILADIGIDQSAAQARLVEMKPKGGASTVYRSTIEGVRLLGNYSARRRALLLFSAGKSKDESYKLDDVVNEARRQHVAIFTFGIAERSADAKLRLEPLMQMAELTGGRYFQSDVDSRHFADRDLDAVLKHLDNGGWVSVDAAGVTPDATIELAFATTGTPASLTYRTSIQSIDLATPPSVVVTQLGWFGKAWSWIQAHQLVSVLVGAAVVLLLFALIIWAVRGMRRRHRSIAATPALHPETYRLQPDYAPTSAVNQGTVVPIATLQPVLNTGSPHAVNASMVTIGRASDCDIRLSDETVSAHHATLVRKRDGTFELSDMGSRNGVRVNGERVERKRVSNGDKIELGAAQFRFVLDNALQRAS